MSQIALKAQDPIGSQKVQTQQQKHSITTQHSKKNASRSKTELQGACKDSKRVARTTGYQSSHIPFNASSLEIKPSDIQALINTAKLFKASH